MRTLSKRKGNEILVFVLLLSAVVLVSGCVEGGGFDAIWGGVGTEEVEEPDNVLVIENERVEPSVVNAGNLFDFSFELKNLFERESAEGVTVRLYDTGMCELDSDAKQIDDEVIFEEATRVVEWSLTAPGNKELGGMTRSCALYYDVEYEFDAHSRSDLYVMGEDVSRDSTVAQVSPSTSKSRGPLKIDIHTSGKQPFRNGTVIPFQIKLRNAGEGELSDLNPYDVNITVNYGGDDSVELGGDEYLDEDEDWNGNTGCRHPMGYESNDDNENNEVRDFQFINDETPPISCRLYPKGDKGYSEDRFEEPLSSFQIEVDVEDYSYKLSGVSTVTVQPTL